MSSLLRFAVTSATGTAVPTTTHRPNLHSPPTKKQKMSLTQTYYLAHTARGKLSNEAARGDHNLRLLVGHANLLDGLMLDLANAEQEQESWFNQTVKAAEEPKQLPRVSWADQHTVIEEDAVEEDNESDDEEEEVDMAVALRKAPAHSIHITISAAEEDAQMEDDFDEELSLTRTPSHSHSPTDLSPPELMQEDSDSSDSEEDDAMPPTPRQTELILSEKQRQAIATTSFYESSSKPLDGPLFPQESPQVAIAAY